MSADIRGFRFPVTFCIVVNQGESGDKLHQRNLLIEMVDTNQRISARTSYSDSEQTDLLIKSKVPCMIFLIHLPQCRPKQQWQGLAVVAKESAGTKGRLQQAAAESQVARFPAEAVLTGAAEFPAVRQLAEEPTLVAEVRTGEEGPLLRVVGALDLQTETLAIEK